METPHCSNGSTFTPDLDCGDFVRERRCEMLCDYEVRNLEVGVQSGDSLGISISKSASRLQHRPQIGFNGFNFAGGSLPFIDVIFGYLSCGLGVLLALEWPVSQRECISMFDTLKETSPYVQSANTVHSPYVCESPTNGFAVASGVKTNRTQAPV